MIWPTRLPPPPPKKNLSQIKLLSCFDAFSTYASYLLCWLMEMSIDLFSPLLLRTRLAVCMKYKVIFLLSNADLYILRNIAIVTKDKKMLEVLKIFLYDHGGAGFRLRRQLQHHRTIVWLLPSSPLHPSTQAHISNPIVWVSVAWLKYIAIIICIFTFFYFFCYVENGMRW